VDFFESQAVLIHSEPRNSFGIVTNLYVLSPKTVSPTRKFDCMDQLDEFAESFTVNDFINWPSIGLEPVLRWVFESVLKLAFETRAQPDSNCQYLLIGFAE